MKQRYEFRQEQKRNGNHLFDEWTTPQPFFKLFQEFDRPDREALPSGEPVPVIHFDSEHNQAKILLSDGSETIKRIMEAINKPEKVKV